jgi:hypothetical protein
MLAAALALAPQHMQHARIAWLAKSALGILHTLIPKPKLGIAIALSRAPAVSMFVP